MTDIPLPPVSELSDSPSSHMSFHNDGVERRGRNVPLSRAGSSARVECSFVSALDSPSHFLVLQGELLPSKTSRKGCTEWSVRQQKKICCPFGMSGIHTARSPNLGVD